MAEQAILQREDVMLPIIVARGFSIHKSGHAENYCITCDLKNIGNGPALGVLVSFFDPETDGLIGESEHYIDFLEGGVSEESPHIHIPIKDFDNIRYKQNKRGRMNGELVGRINFHDFHNNHHFSKQEFSFSKESMTIEPVIGSFRFVKRG